MPGLDLGPSEIPRYVIFLERIKFESHLRKMWPERNSIRGQCESQMRLILPFYSGLSYFDIYATYTSSLGESAHRPESSVTTYYVKRRYY